LSENLPYFIDFTAFSSFSNSDFKYQLVRFQSLHILILYYFFIM